MFGLPAEKPWTLENFFAVIFSWDTEEVNLPNFVSTAMFFFFRNQPLFSNFPLFRVLETQLTFMAVGEPDYTDLTIESDTR